MMAATASRAGGRVSRLAVAFCVTALLASALPVAQATGPDWPGFQKDAKHTGLQTGTDLPEVLEIVWQLHLTGQVKSSPIVADGIVFIGTDAGNIYGLDARNGNALWGPVKLGEPIMGTPAHENDRLYIATSKLDGSTGKIYVLNAATGAFIQNVTLDKGSYGGPVISDGKLFVGHDGGKLVAFDTESMTKLWEFSTAVTVDTSTIPQDGYGRDDCCTKTNIAAKAVKTVPLVYGERVYFGSFNHQFFSVDSGGNPGAETTTVQWVENLQDIIYSSAGAGRGKWVTKELIIVGSYDGRLYAFDNAPLEKPESCPTVPDRLYHPVGMDCSYRIWWIHDTGSRIFASPAVANGRAYVGDEGGTMRAIHVDSGNEAWSYKTGNTIRSSAAVLNNTIVVGSYDGKLYMFKEDADGKLLPGYPKTVALSDKIHASPALAEDKVFVATQDGILYALAAPGTSAPGGPPTPVGDPDFTLQDLVLTPRKAVAAQPLEVAVAVHNKGGNAPGPVNLRLYNGETLLDEANVTVNGGTSMVHLFTFTPQQGDLFLKLVIDENDTITEANEADNLLEQHHVVDPASAPSPTDTGTTDETGGDGGGSGEGDDEDAPAPPMALIVLTVALVGLALRRSARRE